MLFCVYIKHSTTTMMTHGRRRGGGIVALRNPAAFALLLLFVVAGSARAQDVNTNEVLPFLANLKPTEAPDTSATATVCPPAPANPLARILGVNCEKSADCSFLGAEQRCCKGICRKGIEAPIYEPPHGDLLGIRRRCPADTFPEQLPIKRCSKDADCEGYNRICCPDKKDRKLYCRTAAPLWQELPFIGNQDALKTLVGFVQCQAAPPPVLDIFARPCNRTLDCLPNLCCQEGSKKICRPPKRSVLSLAAQAATFLFQRFIRG